MPGEVGDAGLQGVEVGCLVDSGVVQAPCSDIPPLSFSARTEATTTLAAGGKPPATAVMSMNFWPPRSRAEAGLRDDDSASRRAVLVAMIELAPWAMLANGPPWIRAADPPRVCTRFGLRASLSSTAMAPWAPFGPRSPTVTGCWS